MSTRREIIIAFDTRHAAAREVIDGFMRYAVRKKDWSVTVLCGHPAFASLVFDPRKPYDGLVADDVMFDLLPSAMLAKGFKAAVFACEKIPRRRTYPHLRVLSDNSALGEAAARFLLAKNRRSFAFVGTPFDDNWSRERMSAFSDAIRAAGCEVRALCHGQTDLERDRTALERFLVSLPKPCALYASFDHRAKQVLDLAAQLGISVPEELIVLGTDNDRILCEYASPSLSSVDPDFDGAGMMMGEALDRLFAGNIAAHADLRYRPKGVVERASTIDLHGAARTVNAAMDFIRRNASGQITVGDVANAAGSSLRMLEGNFKKVHGVTVAHALQTARLDLVKSMLATTSFPIAHVAGNCGFGNDTYLKVLFKRRFGVTMRAFRRQCQRT